MPPKTIFIDWYGTLSDSTFWGHIPSIDTELYPLRLTAESTLFGELSDLIAPWMRGDYTAEEIIYSVSQKSSLCKEKLLKQFILSTEKMVVDPEVLTLVGRLRGAGTKVVIATDNMDSFTRWTTPALGLTHHFDGILNSYELKVLKKDFDTVDKSLFFGSYLQENGLRPDECVLVDDSEDRDGNIQKFGIEYIKINQSTELKDILASIISR